MATRPLSRALQVERAREAALAAAWDQCPGMDVDIVAVVQKPPDWIPGLQAADIVISIRWRDRGAGRKGKTR